MARSAGLSSRTLRHYDAIGLLPATAVGDGGLRRYDDRALVRLQRILLLRGSGLGLTEVARRLGTDLSADGDTDDDTDDDAAALAEHLVWLERERDRLARQLAAVRTTVVRLERGDRLTAAEAFDGFAPTRSPAAEAG